MCVALFSGEGGDVLKRPGFEADHFHIEQGYTIFLKNLIATSKFRSQIGCMKKVST